MKASTGGLATYCNMFFKCMVNFEVNFLIAPLTVVSSSEQVTRSTTGSGTLYSDIQDLYLQPPVKVTNVDAKSMS